MRHPAVTTGIALCVAFSGLQAQNIQLGAKAGMAITNFVGDEDTDFESKVSFVGGFPLSYPVNRNLFLTPEILYVIKGAEQLAIINSAPAEVRTSVTYIELPILIKYIALPRRRWSPIITAGPVFSWRIDARSRYNRPGSDIQLTEIEDSVKELDFGTAIGGGVDLLWDLRRITLELRYTHGLTNLTDEADDPKHNSVVSLTAGVGL